jgi:hypothetical protein
LAQVQTSSSQPLPWLRSQALSALSLASFSVLPLPVENTPLLSIAETAAQLFEKLATSLQSSPLGLQSASAPRSTSSCVRLLKA